MSDPAVALFAALLGFLLGTWMAYTVGALALSALHRMLAGRA